MFVDQQSALDYFVGHPSVGPLIQRYVKKNQLGSGALQNGAGWFDSFVNWTKGAAKKIYEKVLKPVYTVIKPAIAPIWKSGVIGELATKVNPTLGAAIKSVGGKKRSTQRRRRTKVGGMKVVKRVGSTMKVVNQPSRRVVKF